MPWAWSDLAPSHRPAYAARPAVAARYETTPADAAPRPLPASDAARPVPHTLRPDGSVSLWRLAGWCDPDPERLTRWVQAHGPYQHGAQRPDRP